MRLLPRRSKQTLTCIPNMARLCEDFHPALSPPVLDSLFRKSIFTCLTFVRTDPELLAKITGLQYGQILEIKDGILTKFSSKLRFGDKYYREIINHCALLSSGIDNLDKLLNSGFMTGNIYELCGFSGCGKTQICMTTAINIASTKEQQVFYIDTKNDISAIRLAEIAEHKKIENVGETLGRIQICQVRSAVDLLQQLHQLESRLSNSKEKYLGFRLIIIDSLSALFQQFHDQSECLSHLNNLASLLKYISVEYHLAVLLTNFVKSWIVEEMEGGEEEEQQQSLQQVQEPALGKYWAHIPNVRIMVKRSDGSSDGILVVLKSPDLPVGKSVRIKLGDDGVT